MKKFIMMLVFIGIGFSTISAFSDSIGADESLGHYCSPAGC